MRRLKVSIETIEPKPDSIIIAKCYTDDLMQYRARDLYDMLKKAFPDNKVVIFPSDFRLKEVSPKQFWDFVEQLKVLRPKEERKEHNT